MVGVRSAFSGWPTIMIYYCYMNQGKCKCISDNTASNSLIKITNLSKRRAFHGSGGNDGQILQ